MTGGTEVTPRGARLVHWANLYLFSLNLAWITTTYKAASWTMTDYWLLAGRQLLYLYRKIHMPNPPICFFILVWAFALSVPIFLILLLMARASRARTCLRAFAGAFAIVAYPFFALLLSTDWIIGPPESGLGIMGPLRIPESEWRLLLGTSGLLLETVAVLACGVLYYLRRWPHSTRVGALLLLGHFGLWAWVTHCYGNPYAILTNSFPYPSKGGSIVPGIKIWLPLSLSMMFLYSFPGIGFLSALSSGLDFRLSSGRAARATGTVH